MLLEVLNSVLMLRSPSWRLYLTDGIPVSCPGSGSSVKVTLTLVEERRRRSSDCISVGKTAT